MSSSARPRNHRRSDARRDRSTVSRPNRNRRRKPERLQFTKMHGLGNDFVVLDLVSQPFAVDSALIRRLANRHTGIGCDQVLLVEPPDSPDVDFRYRIFNADGEEVEQCGNGARCFARYVREKQLTGKNLIKVHTLAGVIELRVINREQIAVDMGAPKLIPADIPLLAAAQAPLYNAVVAGQTIQFGAVSMGNPHAVITVADVADAEVATLGPALQQYDGFPASVNVGFMQVQSRSSIALRVYERGVGETLACGTGACAAVVSGIVQGVLDDTVSVTLPGGELEVHWAGPGTSVIMTGPTAIVFDGEFRL